MKKEPFNEIKFNPENNIFLILKYLNKIHLEETKWINSSHLKQNNSIEYNFKIGKILYIILIKSFYNEIECVNVIQINSKHFNIWKAKCQESVCLNHIRYLIFLIQLNKILYK